MMFVYKIVVTTLAVLLEISLVRVFASDNGVDVRTGIFVMGAVLMAATLGMWG